jgi:hypothetical protein
MSVGKRGRANVIPANPFDEGEPLFSTADEEKRERVPGGADRRGAGFGRAAARPPA